MKRVLVQVQVLLGSLCALGAVAGRSLDEVNCSAILGTSNNDGSSSSILEISRGALVNCSTTVPFRALPVTLPKPLSDHTATLLPHKNDKTVYIAGGCDDPNGSEFQPSVYAFFCGSISDSFYAFDLVTEEFTILPNLPRPRYRHAAAAIHQSATTGSSSGNTLILIMGGRTLEDDIIREVDIFDVDGQTWCSFTVPSAKVEAASDLASWSNGTHAFFAGGYSADYTALRQVFSVHLDQNYEEPTPQYANHADLREARGDVTGTLRGGYAYVGGGFTHANDFCTPLSSVERYGMATDIWMPVADLPSGRGEMILLSTEGDDEDSTGTTEPRVLAMGGEGQDLCQGSSLDPSEMFATVDQVAVLEESDTQWRVISDELVLAKFRFAAVAYEGVVFTFGGQLNYNAECQCLPTTDQLIAYHVEEAPAQAPSSSTTSSQPTFPTLTPRETIVRSELARVVGEVVNTQDAGPYQQAMDWILYADPMQLDEYSDHLVQRYVMVLFYYATTQDNPWVSCNPPGPGEDETCIYYEYTRQSDGSIAYLPRDQPHIRWLSERHECQWAQVECLPLWDGEVIAMDHPGQNLTRTIPSELKHLRFLYWLTLSANRLSGSIPEALADLPYMTYFEAHGNAITGQIPASFFQRTNLVQLDLSYTLVTGSIPTEISQATKLHALFLQNTLLSGSIPSEVGQMEDLYKLWLFDNPLMTGPMWASSRGWASSN